MQDADLLLTIAEVAVAFTGFASLVSIFGSASSLEHPLIQSVRFRAMVIMSLTVVAFSLVPFVPMRLGVSPLASWRISSALFLLIGMAGAFNGGRQLAASRATVGVVKGGAIRSGAVFGVVGVALLLLGANALGFTAALAPGVYVAALLLFLLGSGVAFVALLFSYIHPVMRDPPAA